MADFKETVSIDDCLALKSTPKALYIELPGGQKEWIPQSQIDDRSEVWKEGDQGVLVISLWIAQQKNIEP